MQIRTVRLRPPVVHTGARFLTEICPTPVRVPRCLVT